MGTRIQDTPQHHPDSQPRWDRLERADLFEPYRELRTQGLSERQAARELKGPRTTLQAWRTWHDRLDICPQVAACFPSGPGLACVPRLVVGFPRVGVAVGACGMRLACLVLTLPGLERFVAASYGAQHQVNGQGEAALGAARHTATARVAKDRPRTDLPVTQDATLPGGLCLVGSEPVSHFMLVEQRAQRRDHAAWHALMAPALAQRNGHVRPSTSEDAPGLWASVAHPLEAHHAPDVCHGQHALRKAVWAPLATQERAAPQAATAAQAQREQGQAPLLTAGDEPAQRGPGRPPQAPVRLAHAQQERATARREPERLAPQRAYGAKSIRGLGHDDHGVDRERGGRRHGPRLAAESQAHREQVRALAQHDGLSQRGVERLAQAERGVPTMPATIACVSGDGRHQVEPRDVTPPASFAMHAKLLPASDLDRVAQTRRVRDGEALRELAERLRTPLCEPGGTLGQMRSEAQDQLHQQAKTLADVCQRSSAHVEGRHGSLS